MPKIQTNAKELIFTKTKNEKGFCDTFIFEPENIQEQLLGNLYILAEVSNISNNSPYLINLIASIIKKEYYSNPKRAPLESLEASLGKANLSLADFAQQGNVDWIGYLNVVVAVFKDNILHFTQTGQAKILLLRQGQLLDVGKNLILNVKPHPLKTFTNIASGPLETSDQLILATPEILHCFSLAEIAKLFQNKAGDEALLAIQEKLKGENEKIAGILLLKLEEAPETTFVFETFQKAEISPSIYSSVGHPLKLNEIIGEKMSQIQKPELGQQKIDESPPKADAPLEHILRRKEIIEQTYEDLKKIRINEFKKQVFRTLKTSFNILYQATKDFVRFLTPLIIRLTKKLIHQTRRFATTLKEILTKKFPFIKAFEEKINIFKNVLIDALQKIKKLPYSTKILLVISIVLAIALFGSFKSSQIKKQYNLNVTGYASLLEQAIQKTDQAEAALIYKDENRARALLKEALILTGQVISSSYLEREASELQERIKIQLDKVDRVIRISEPQILADFSPITKNNAAPRLLKLGNFLYSFNSFNNSVFEYDLAKKTGALAKIESRDIGHIQLATISSDKIIFYTDTPGVASFDPVKNELKPLAISFTQKGSDIRDIASWGANIYLLDAKNNNIYKYPPILGGFGKGKEWLGPNELRDLTNAVSMTIDGAIYVLKENGIVEKYLGGKKNDFKLVDLTIPLSQTQKISTSAENRNIYISDLANKRIVIFDKKGNLVSQYTSEKFTQLRDFAVDEKEKKMYILNGDMVMELGL